MRYKIPLTLSAAGLMAIAASAGFAQTQPARAPTTAPSTPDRSANLTRADAEARAAAMFDRLDANHDGRLTAEDRVAAHAAHRAAMFDAADTNHDGSISRAEWDAAGAAMEARHAARQDRGGDRDGDRGRRWGRGGDRMGMRGGDGPDANRVVDRATFIAAAMQRFDRADANHDGVLTPAERQAAHRSRDGMRGGMGHHRGGPGGWQHGPDGDGPGGPEGDMPPPA